MGLEQAAAVEEVSITAAVNQLMNNAPGVANTGPAWARRAPRLLPSRVAQEDACCIGRRSATWCRWPTTAADDQLLVC